MARGAEPERSLRLVTLRLDRFALAIDLFAITVQLDADVVPVTAARCCSCRPMRGCSAPR
jgi:hypothetical protein